MSRTRTHRPRRRSPLRILALAALLGIALAGCGEGASTDTDPDPVAEDVGAEDAAADAPETESQEAATTDDGPHIVVTTSILGDVVRTLVGEDGRVDVVMPPGTDPHGFQPSAADAAMFREADLVVANGLDLEEPLLGALQAAEEDGVPVFTLADKLDPIEYEDGDEHGHEDEDDQAHEDEDDQAHEDEDDQAHEDDDRGHEDEDDQAHEDEDDHDADDHGPEDPHVWFDPIRMAEGVQLLAAEIATVDTQLDAAEWETRGEASAAELRQLDEDLQRIFADIPADDRLLVTNHDALGYLAARYDFELVGTVIPGSSTQAEADAQGFAELIETVEDAGVSAVFAENTDSTALADQLASEVIGRGDLDVEVVRIYTDALGEDGTGAETYPGMMRTTATLIADALR